MLPGWKFTPKKLKYTVDESFFSQWSSAMAYLLGFTYADGNIYLTSLSWDIQLRDINLLKKIAHILKTNYPITIHRERSCRLRISNQKLTLGAIQQGLYPKKNLRKRLPLIPKEYLNDFIRGYLDGDGWILRRKGRNEINIGFSGANNKFLEDLNIIISNQINIKPGKVRTKCKITPRGVTSTTYQLEYYSSNAFKIAQWIYENVNDDDLYLDRKYKIYLLSKDLYIYLQSGSKKVRIVQGKQNKQLKEILEDLYLTQKLDGVQIAQRLGVHSSSIYRWLAQSGVKYPNKRIVDSNEQNRRTP